MTMNDNRIFNIRAHTEKKKLIISFSISESFSRYFRSHEFRCEYTENIDSIPYGIAVIPFVCNVLPFVWLTDATLELDELDEDFASCINELRIGYKSMYPNLDFKGEIKSKRIKYNTIDKQYKSISFFSGGVDAFATLIAHIEEHPTLFGICGADIKIDNKEGWTIVEEQIAKVSEQFKIDAIYCHTNFREFTNEEALNRFVTELGANDDWWHGFQHGIGLIGHAAPLAYLYGYKTTYIASSYTIRERPYITCASDPRIDNHVQFCGSIVCHDQFEFNRQDKIKHIVDYCRSHDCKIKLRVCWRSTDGNNCCKCEKCIRTVFALLAEKEDPKAYGFDDVNLREMKYQLLYKIKMQPLMLPFWDDIIDRLKEQDKGSTQIEWLRRYNANKLNNNIVKRVMPKIIKLLKKLNFGK